MAFVQKVMYTSSHNRSAESNVGVIKCGRMGLANAILVTISLRESVVNALITNNMSLTSKFVNQNVVKIRYG